MKNLVNYTIKISLTLLILVSCKKGEIPVAKPNLEGITTTSIDLTSTYEYQIYFDLSSNSNKGVNHKTDWDLGFSCSTDSIPYIILNTSKVMLISVVNNQTFDQISNVSNFNNNTKTDHPSGRIDSLALSTGNLFIIDRGYDGEGNHQGYFKMEIISHTHNDFNGKFANINGSNEQMFSISKNPSYNFVYMKWNPTTPISTPTIEPEKTEWDLIFTQFTEIFYHPTFMPYSVVGCLTNSYKTQAIKVINQNFNEIDLDFAQNLILSNDRNTIGYDWKTFLFEQNKFEVHSEKIYIIKDQEGDYYKLRFIDFYNEIGEKGSPKFEFQKL